LDAPQNYQFGETTFRGYSDPFQTLNVERLLFSPLRGLTVVKRSAVLNGIFQGPPLNATALTLPKLIVLLLQMESLVLILQKVLCSGKDWIAFVEKK